MFVSIQHPTANDVSEQFLLPSLHLNLCTFARSHHEDNSALLRYKMEELNKNTVRLIAETQRLIQESKQLSERIKCFRESQS